MSLPRAYLLRDGNKGAARANESVLNFSNERPCIVVAVDLGDALHEKIRLGLQLNVIVRVGGFESDAHVCLLDVDC